MSKKVKVILGVSGILALLIWLFVYFLNPRQKTQVVQQEISIEEATIGIDNYLTHKNFAGFEFEYPDNLTLTETELDNDNVYASIEMVSNSGQKMTLRIFDDSFTDTETWLDQFETNNVAIDVTNLLWSDIPAKRFESGAPTTLSTVAAEESITYWLQSPADSAFFIKAHEHVISSFRFLPQSAPTTTVEVPTETDSDNITLVEETIL